MPSRLTVSRRMACRPGHHVWYRLGRFEEDPPDEERCVCGAFPWRQRREAWEWQHALTWWVGERC